MVINMKKLNENVTALLKAQLWTLGTFGTEPNAVPVAFKDVTPDGKLAVGDVFLETTLKNISANGRIAVSVYDPATMEGYQIKGSAEYVTSGDVVDVFRKLVSDMFKGAATAKGALVITPEKVIVTTPGSENKKEL
jgi:predicted pyridoxine 5'-phosphate oxidase superfamily flavin-nucleotide-binding protein